MNNSNHQLYGFRLKSNGYYVNNETDASPAYWNAKFFPDYLSANDWLEKTDWRGEVAICIFELTQTKAIMQYK